MKSKNLKIWAYRGGKLFLDTFPEGIVLDFEGILISREKIPALWVHDHKTLAVGQIDDASIGKEGLILSGKLWLETSLTKLIDQYAAAGHEWGASVGVEPLQVEWIERGGKFEANGKIFEGPCYYSRQWDLREISILPVPADPQTKVAIG